MVLKDLLVIINLHLNINDYSINPIFIMSRMMKKAFDFIVIGAGSSGCLLSNRLSKIFPEKSILLIEAGKSDKYYLPFHIPAGYLYCINNPRSDWMFSTTPQQGLNHRSISYPRGKGLGGCSSINGMIYMRGQAQDFDYWASLVKDPKWNWKSVLERYKTFECYHGGKNLYHNDSGEWKVQKQRLNWEILDNFRDAMISYGIPANSDFNTGDNNGVGYFDVNQNDGWRLNASQAFLRNDSINNLTIANETIVNRIIFDQSNRVVAVEYKSEGESHVNRVEVTKDVILCAGSIGNVQILERSGVGRIDILQSLSIPVVKDLCGVGENLQDHLQLRCIYKLNDKTKTLNITSNSLIGKIKIGMQYLLKRSGPLSMAPSQLGCFTFSSQSHERPNIQYHVQPLSLDKFGEPLHEFNAITASVCNLRPTSRGSVHIHSNCLDSKPLISPNYLSTPQDKQVAIDSIRLTRMIMNSNVMSAFDPIEYKPGNMSQTDDELVTAAGDIGTTIFHPVGMYFYKLK